MTTQLVLLVHAADSTLFILRSGLLSMYFTAQIPSGIEIRVADSIQWF
jgi:hypothetical protein